MSEITGLKTSDYYYDLPERLIAQDPLRDRSSSRLMVLHKETGEVEHRSFTDIIDYLETGDCLVLNDTRVIPARLIGTRIPKGSDGTHVSGGGRFHEGGSAAEILLLKRLSEDTWETIVHPGKKLREGDMVVFGEGTEGKEEPALQGGRNQHPRGIGPAFGDQCPWGAGSFPLTATIKEVLPDGNRIVQFSFKGIWEEVLNTLGEMPLPPYITHKLQDKDRYQTVYARYEGSAAAPTAGLHFTKELLQKIEDKGIRLAYVTLHVGLGTFRPVKVDDVTKHHMHSEWYQVTQETADIINRTHAEGHRVICVGTTSCRTVETAASLRFKEEPAPQGHSGPAFGDQNAPGVLVPSAHSTPLHAATGDTSIFIYPGFQFRVMDGLITNFHLPESTLLMLVSAFAGREHILAAYEEAVKEEYRFFSFGDAMLIV